MLSIAQVYLKKQSSYTVHTSVFLHSRIEELYEADVYVWRHVTDCHKLFSCQEGQH